MLYGMTVTERLEIRLDAEHRRKLAELAAARGEPMATVVRDAIDRMYEATDRERRRAIARELGAMEIEDVPGPEELARQLDSAHDPGVR
jgi:hypothetical protein